MGSQTVRHDQVSNNTLFNYFFKLPPPFLLAVSRDLQDLP